MHWQTLEVSPDGTHHVKGGAAVYSARFLSVLKFHNPGFAPAEDDSGAFHIDAAGESIYTSRFLRTFGFYEERAAVQAESGWYHILPDGSPLYSKKFAWCGNFQEGYCAVKDFDGKFYHIDRKGGPPYRQTFRYVGDFHDRYAVVQNAEGFHTHINEAGHFIHGKWLIDLDVYHKGFAKAKDQNGWFHINLQGQSIYSQRYKNVEPFYNGVARVETHRGELRLINEKGEKIGQLREELEDEFHQVSAELVSYWRFYTLQSAIEVQLFDYLPASLQELAQYIDLPETSTDKLLCALQEMGYLEIAESGQWTCTPKGAFLQSAHPYSLMEAGRLWKEEHLTCWSNLTYALKTGSPVFSHLFEKGWFDWLKDHPGKNQQYHAALSTYARRDYKAFCSSINFSKHNSLADVGGSTGFLLFSVLDQNPHLNGTLLDLPHVIQLVNIPFHLQDRVHCVSTNFFEEWPSFHTESAVLSRVLHDWPDQEALQILKRVRAAFSDNPNNRLYLLEKVQEKGSSQGALLNLNMLVMTGGVERSLEDFEDLLKKSGFVLEKVVRLNQASSILIAKQETL